MQAYNYIITNRSSEDGSFNDDDVASGGALSFTTAAQGSNAVSARP